MIFGLVFCPLSHTKRSVIGGGTRCILKMYNTNKQAEFPIILLNFLKLRYVTDLPATGSELQDTRNWNL